MVGMKQVCGSRERNRGKNPVEQIMARSKGRITELPMKYFPDFGQVISPQGFDFSPEGLADHRIEKL